MKISWKEKAMGWVWKERQSWRGSYRDEAGKQHTKSFKRQVDAKRWVATEEAKVVRGDWIDPAAGKVTFAAFYADWAPRQVWLSSTRENADLATAGVTFGNMQLRSIRRSHIEAWVKNMTARLAPTTIDTRFTIVRGVFRAAVADRLIASDPTAGVVLPRKRKAEAAMSIPTSAGVAKVLRAAEPERRPKSRPGFTAYVALCAFAGLRRGEALGVQVGDIDFLGRTLRVSRQLQRAKATDVAAGKNLVEAAGGITVVIRPPKYESERTIYLPDEVITFLSEHVRRAHAGRRTVTVALRRGGEAVARQSRRLPLAVDPHGRRGHLQAPRAAALLRQWPHRGRLRRCHGPARDGSRIRYDDAEHVHAPVADGRGQDPRGRVRNGVRGFGHEQELRGHNG
jgi:integrase